MFLLQMWGRIANMASTLTAENVSMSFPKDIPNDNNYLWCLG